MKKKTKFNTSLTSMYVISNQYCLTLTSVCRQNVCRRNVCRRNVLVQYFRLSGGAYWQFSCKLLGPWAGYGAFKANPPTTSPFGPLFIIYQKDRISHPFAKLRWPPLFAGRFTLMKIILGYVKDRRTFEAGKMLIILY